VSTCFIVLNAAEEEQRHISGSGNFENGFEKFMCNESSCFCRIFVIGHTSLSDSEIVFLLTVKM
jgi:hypothetical protein